MLIVLGKPRIVEGAVGAFLRLAILEGPALVTCRVVGLSHKGRELTSRYRNAPNRKWLGDRHLVLWTLIVIPTRLTCRRTHGEAARWHDHHLGTIRAIFEAVLGLEATFLVADLRRDAVAPLFAKRSRIER